MTYTMCPVDQETRKKLEALGVRVEKKSGRGTRAQQTQECVVLLRIALGLADPYRKPADQCRDLVKSIIIESVRRECDKRLYGMVLRR
jgi:hypothetical protein